MFVDALSRGLKMEQNSPTAAAGGSFAFSRASSIGSVNAISCSSASSTHNTGHLMTLLNYVNWKSQACGILFHKDLGLSLGIPCMICDSDLHKLLGSPS